MSTPQAQTIPDAVAARETTVGETTLQTLTGGSPDETPEVLRLALQISGVTDSIERALAELYERLAHVTRDAEPYPPAAVDRLPAETALGQQLGNTYDQLTAVDERLHRLAHRLAV